MQPNRDTGRLEVVLVTLPLPGMNPQVCLHLVKGVIERFPDLAVLAVKRSPAILLLNPNVYEDSQLHLEPAPKDRLKREQAEFDRLIKRHRLETKVVILSRE